jgi:hypothetical protein
MFHSTWEKEARKATDGKSIISVVELRDLLGVSTQKATELLRNVLSWDWIFDSKDFAKHGVRYRRPMIKTEGMITNE